MLEHKPLATMLIRPMGVMFAIGGLVGIIASGYDAYVQYKIADDLGHTAPYAVNSFAIGWTIASVVQLCIGVYLVFGGRFVLDAIFHESIDSESNGSEDSLQDIAADPLHGHRNAESVGWPHTLEFSILRV